MSSRPQWGVHRMFMSGVDRGWNDELGRHTRLYSAVWVYGWGVSLTSSAPFPSSILKPIVANRRDAAAREYQK
jgi:hypothetical protein